MAWNVGEMRAWIEREAMTQEQVDEALSLLAEQFNIPKPLLKWGRARRGKAIYTNSNHPAQIVLGPNCAFGLEPGMVHEFAHALAFTQYVFGHGPTFCRILWEVAKAWYGDATKYPWIREYHTVARYGQQMSRGGR